MATYKYAKEIGYSQNDTIPSNLKADKMLSDDLMNSSGLYSRSDIEEAKFSKFSRFGRVLDPYGRLTDCREYLFFVKPDLHICVPNKDISASVYQMGGYNKLTVNDLYTGTSGLALNPQLNGNSYFKDLIDTHPDVIKELQYSVSGGNYAKADPFGHLLSFTCSSYLDLPGSQSTTLDNPATMFGTNYEYLWNSEESDENQEFQLEFVDNKYLDTYHFFKAYSEYHISRKSGLVTPPSDKYYKYRRLHNTMGIYKFLVAEDMETIIYWAYFWGVYPTTCPRETFGDPLFNDGLTFSVSFKSAFMEDMNPMILYQFNQLMQINMANYGLNKNKWLPVIKQNHTQDRLTTAGSGTHSYDQSLGTMNRTETINGFVYQTGLTDQINGTLPKAALVDGRRYNELEGERLKYRLRWYG